MDDDDVFVSFEGRLPPDTPARRKHLRAVAKRALDAHSIDVVAKAICLMQFGDDRIHGEARCCQVGGVDGCCVKSLRETAVAVLVALTDAKIIK